MPRRRTATDHELSPSNEINNNFNSKVPNNASNLEESQENDVNRANTNIAVDFEQSQKSENEQQFQIPYEKFLPKKFPTEPSIANNEILLSRKKESYKSSDRSSSEGVDLSGSI